MDLHLVWHLRLRMSNMEEDSISIFLNVVELDQLSCYLKEYYTKNYAQKSGSDLYAFVTNSVLKDSNISIIIEDVEIATTYRGPASYTLYSTVAGLTFINWNNVTFRGNSHFTENDSPMIAAYKSNIHMTGQLLFRKNTGTTEAAIQLFLHS